MIKIKTGPLLEKYATVFVMGNELTHQEAQAEVIGWVSAYVNGPWPEGLQPHLEPTERERFDSIKAYIQTQLDSTIGARIARERAQEALQGENA